MTSVTNRNSSNTVLSSFEYTYNDDDMRTYVEEADGSTVTYSYNANGEQTGRTLSGTAYTLSYDYEGQLTQVT